MLQSSLHKDPSVPTTFPKISGASEGAVEKFEHIFRGSPR